MPAETEKILEILDGRLAIALKPLDEKVTRLDEKMEHVIRATSFEERERTCPWSMRIEGIRSRVKLIWGVLALLGGVLLTAVAQQIFGHVFRRT
jgi:hypothetical protein